MCEHSTSFTKDVGRVEAGNHRRLWFEGRSHGRSLPVVIYRSSRPHPSFTCHCPTCASHGPLTLLACGVIVGCGAVHWVVINERCSSEL
jgi:hypothetical protein